MKRLPVKNYYSKPVLKWLKVLFKTLGSKYNNSGHCAYKYHSSYRLLACRMVLYNSRVVCKTNKNTTEQASYMCGIVRIALQAIEQVQQHKEENAPEHGLPECFLYIVSSEQ